MKTNITDNKIAQVAEWLADGLVKAGHFKDNATATGYLLKELRARSSVETVELYEKMETLGLLAKQEYPLAVNNIEYIQLTGIGEAKEIDSNSSDWTSTAISTVELLNKTWSLDSSWSWNYEEDSNSLPEIARVVSRRRENAIEVLLRGLDNAIALGNAKKKVKGLINQPTGGSNIPLKTLDYDVNNATFLASATSGRKLYEDLVAEIEALEVDSLNHIKATHVLFSSQMYKVYNTKLYSDQAPQRILDLLKSQYPTITFMSWSKLNSTSSGLPAHRIVILNNEKSNMEMAHCGPLFAEHEPEKQGLQRKVGLTTKTGGLMLYRKEALRYVDNGEGDGT